MKYILPSPHFQSICVLCLKDKVSCPLRSLVLKVSYRQRIIGSGFFIDLPLCVFRCGACVPLKFGVIIDKYVFFYFILFLNFTILYWFFQILKCICHRYTCVPHPEPSSLLPPHTIPLGRPSAPAPSIQYCASNLDWRLVSFMILYMFQCHSPKSSHPLPLPQSP